MTLFCCSWFCWCLLWWVWPNNCTTYYCFWTLFVCVSCIHCPWSLWWYVAVCVYIQYELSLHAGHPCYSLFHLLFVWLILMKIIFINNKQFSFLIMILNRIIWKSSKSIILDRYECWIFTFVSSAIWSGCFAK